MEIFIYMFTGVQQAFLANSGVPVTLYTPYGVPTGEAPNAGLSVTAPSHLSRLTKEAASPLNNFWYSNVIASQP